MEIVTIETPSLGDRAYLATDGRVALVVDPQRDYDRVLGVAAELGAEVTHVFETHIHNDYVTGGLALAERTGAGYHVNAADQVAFSRIPVADGDQIKVGALTIRVIGTPGHTYTHLAYGLELAGEAVAVFTGGSLLYGSTGRTDLLGEAHKVALARAQHGSARRLAAELPGGTAIYPTHGFGSFCSATPALGTASTMAGELGQNPVFLLDEESFADSVLAGLDVYPAYYAHMAPANLAGPRPPDLSQPRVAAPGELRRRIDAGEWVVDVRSRVAFAAGHLRGTLAFELGSSLATYLGWLIPWGTPLTLIGQTAEDVVAARRELARIGMDGVAAGAWGDPRRWAGDEPLASFPVTGFDGYAAARDRPGVILLDVRRESEWRAARIDGAVNIPVHELAERMGELPAGQVWVHCQAGYRAAAAASMLAAAGRDVVLITDDFGVAQANGLASSGPVPGY